MNARPSIAVAAIAFVGIASLASILGPRPALAVSNTVVISQVYTAGGDPGASFQNDYVVLFNNSPGLVDVSTWTLQVEVPGPVGPMWEAIPLCGVIPHGRFYLVALPSGGPSGDPLPTADCAGTVGLDGATGKLALVNTPGTLSTPCPIGATELVDFLGYGALVTCSEGLPAPTPNSSQALTRSPGDPCLDTDANDQDFALVAPAPANTASSGNGCNNVAPLVAPIPPQAVDELATLTVTPVGSDANGDPLTWSGSNLPPGSSVAVGTGVFTWTPGGGDAGSYLGITLTAHDPLGGDGSFSFDITVNDVTTPVVDPIPDQTVLEGGSVVVTAAATDADGDPLTWSSTPSLPWITQAPPTSEFTIAPGFDVAGSGGASFPVTVEASDGWNVGSTTFTVHVLDVTTAANTPYAARTWPGVSAATGELSFSAGPDICLGGPRPLCYGRNYGSLFERVGVVGTLGTNWLGSYDWGYVETPSEATVTDPQGRIYRFASAGGGTWSLVEPQDAPYQLTELGTEMSFTHARHRAFYIIDRSTARLARIEDGRGNVHTLTYVSGNLSTVSDGLGRTLTFTHDGSNRVATVTDGTRTVTFGYTGSNLTSVTGAEAKTRIYQYDTGHAVPGLLTAMVDASSGSPVQYTYGADGHVSQVHLGGGNDITHQRTVASATEVQTDIQYPDLGVHSFTHENGRLASYVSPQLDVTLYAYDRQGRFTSATRPSTIVPVTVDYDPVSGFPSTLTLPDAKQWQISYVDRPLITGRVYFTSSVQAPDLGTVNYSYDTVGNLTQVTDQASQSWTMTYNGLGQPLTITNPTSGVTTNTYDPAGRLLSVNDGAGTTQFMYDALDRVTTVTNPDASTKTLSWNGRDQLLSLTNELSKTWTYAYRDNGQLSSVTDPLLATTTFGYDTRNRLSQMIDPEGGIQLWAYDPSWRLGSVTDPTFRAVTYQYDLLGRLTGITDPGGKTTTLGYDVDSRLTSVTDPLTHTWSYGYNNRDQLTSTTDPLLQTTSYAYDAVGRVTAINRPLGLNSTFSYDLRGLRTSATTGPVSVGYSYTSLGLLDTYTDGNGNPWTRGYDAQGRLTSATDPLLRSATYSYDSRNRLTGVVHQEGSATFSYDVASHLTLRSYSDGTAHNYTYDDVGRLLTTEGVVRTYDANGRITEENGLTYTYDDAGRLLTETYAPGKVITHSYAARGLLSQTTDYLVGATTFTYDDAGRLEQVTRPNGTVASYTYDAADRLLSLAETSATDSLGLVELTRDALGRVTSADRRMPLSWPPPSTPGTFAYDAASQVVGFSYDGLGRLIDDGNRAYAWDGASRADSVNQGATTIRFASDGLDRVIQRTLPGSSSLDLIYSPRSSEDDGVTFGDGIRGRRPAAGASAVAPYSSFGSSGSEADDGFYQRVSERLRHKNRALTLYDYERLVLESLPDLYKIRCVNGCGTAVGSGTATPNVIREGGANDRTHRVSTPDGRPLHSIDLSGPSPSPRYYHFDETGNMAFLTNAGGAVVASYAYSPSGKANATGELQPYPALTYKGAYGLIEEEPSGLYRSGDLFYDALTVQSSPTRGSCGCKEKFVRSKPHVAPLPSPSGNTNLSAPGSGVPTPALLPDDQPEKLNLGGTTHDDSKAYGFRVTLSPGPPPDSHPQEVLDLVAAATGNSSSQANRRYLYFAKVADVEPNAFNPYGLYIAQSSGNALGGSSSDMKDLIGPLSTSSPFIAPIPPLFDPLKTIPYPGYSEDGPFVPDVEVWDFRSTRNLVFGR